MMTGDRAAEVPAWFGDVRMAPFHGRGELATLAKRAVRLGYKAVTEEQVARLCDSAAAFLVERCREPCRTRYKGWRRAAGYELVPLEYLLGPPVNFCGKDSAYFGRCVPKAATTECLFDECWQAADRYPRGGTPVRVAADATGFELVFLAPGGPEGSNDVRSEPRLPPAGEPVSCGTPWWRWNGAPTLEDALMGSVHVLCEFRSGERRPLLVNHTWEASAGCWVLGGVCTAGVSERAITSPLEC